jgi:hypothetical protein
MEYMVVMAAAFRPVEIIWLDSGITNSEPEWQPIHRMVKGTKLATVHSVGYLVEETESAYYLIQNYDPQDGQGFNLTVIAKENVREMTYLTNKEGIDI